MPTTIRALKKGEKYLEDIIAANPELLGLESVESGIQGPFAAFTQVALVTPMGRQLSADVVLLSRSGHLVIVEVKLADNDELHDRDVLAQILDYATALSTQDSESLHTLFKGESMSKVLRKAFPDLQEVEELEQVFVERSRTGQIQLVIAADRFPPGLKDLVSAVMARTSVGVDLRLVEVAPFKRADRPEEILLVPQTRVETEVVATTRVVVTYEQGSKPGVTVETSSAEEVAERVASVGRRKWTESSFFEDCARRLKADQISAVRGIYSFASETASSISWGTGRNRGSFNPRFPSVGERSPFTVFSDAGYAACGISGIMPRAFLCRASGAVRREHRQTRGIIRAPRGTPGGDPSAGI